MADNVNYKLDKGTGIWYRREVIGPVSPDDTQKPPVEPKTTPSVPKPPSAVSESKPQKKAEMKLNKKRFNLEGNATVIPDPYVVARKTVEFLGIGTRLSGKYYVKEVIHTWDQNGYTQELVVVRNAFEADAPPPPSPAEMNPVRQPKEKVEPKNNARYYVVKKGDTLWNIAKKYYGNGAQYTKIATANAIKNPNLIYPGQKLLIP